MLPFMESPKLSAMAARKMNGYGKAGGDGGGKPLHVVSCRETVMLAQREAKHADNIPMENLNRWRLFRDGKGRVVSSLINSLQGIALLCDYKQ